MKRRKQNFTDTGFLVILPYAIHPKTTKLEGSVLAPARPAAPAARGIYHQEGHHVLNSFNSRSTLKVGHKEYEIYRLDALDKQGISTKHLPYSLRILLENLLRTEDGRNVTKEEIRALAAWNKNSKPDKEIAFTPSRVLLQDFTGVPCVVDLAAMRDAMQQLGGDPALINPLQPVELVIDHSVQVDEFGTASAFDVNALLEFQRNKERYSFLRWGQTGFRNLAIVPPDTGIVHQVNLEYLSPRSLRPTIQRPHHSLPRHPGRHRQSHDDDQWTRRAGMGRGWHRG